MEGPQGYPNLREKQKQSRRTPDDAVNPYEVAPYLDGIRDLLAAVLVLPRFNERTGESLTFKKNTFILTSDVDLRSVEEQQKLFREMLAALQPAAGDAQSQRRVHACTLLASRRTTPFRRRPHPPFASQRRPTRSPTSPATSSPISQLTPSTCWRRRGRMRRRFA